MSDSMLQINAFAKVRRMRKCESTYANPVLFIPKIYENWMLFMILKSMYYLGFACPKEVIGKMESGLIKGLINVF